MERGAETPKQQEEYHACLAESDELDIELTQLTIAKDTKNSRATRVCSTGVVCMYAYASVCVLLTLRFADENCWWCCGCIAVSDSIILHPGARSSAEFTNED